MKRQCKLFVLKEIIINILNRLPLKLLAKFDAHQQTGKNTLLKFTVVVFSGLNLIKFQATGDNNGRKSSGYRRRQR